jgi:hypothetical protein
VEEIKPFPNPANTDSGLFIEERIHPIPCKFFFLRLIFSLFFQKFE